MNQVGKVQTTSATEFLKFSVKLRKPKPSNFTLQNENKVPVVTVIACAFEWVFVISFYFLVFTT